MKFVSWNVNGLRAVLGKNFLDDFDRFDADFVCLQETKLSEGQVRMELPGYHEYWNYAQKRGYSGTAIFARQAAQDCRLGIGVEEHDREGRVITLTYPDYYLLTVYTPNSQDGLKRLDYRCRWEDDFLAYLKKLEQSKPVIVCGDLNVAHREIDLANPAQNRKNPGFTDQEREKFSTWLAAGFVDSYRHFYPEQKEAYTWWSYRSRARERNVGWRIDYFVLSEALQGRLESAQIYAEVMGSDHCPVGITLR